MERKNKVFNKNNPSTQDETLLVELVSLLFSASDKFVENHSDIDFSDIVFILQNATLNYLKCITRANALLMTNMVKQLDFIELVKKDICTILDTVKTDIKTVNLK